MFIDKLKNIPKARRYNLAKFFWRKCILEIFWEIRKADFFFPLFEINPEISFYFLRSYKIDLKPKPDILRYVPGPDRNYFKRNKRAFFKYRERRNLCANIQKHPSYFFVAFGKRME